MKLLISTTILILLSLNFTGCNTVATTATKPNTIFINSTANVEGCKYLGVVDTTNTKEWKEEFRKQGGDMGATHIVSSGPNGVTGSQHGETVNGNAYFCKK